jgi:hypothetical protein
MKQLYKFSEKQKSKNYLHENCTAEAINKHKIRNFTQKKTMLKNKALFLDSCF